MIEMKTARQWRIVTPRLHPSNVLVNQLGIPEAVLSILANRGIIEPEEINKFLNPSLVHLPDAQLLKGLNQAVQILVEARLLKTPIIIYGDYDADGVTATALLVKFFREIELSVYYFIPDRINDGYGLNCNSLKTLRNIAKIAGHPSPVLLTVDCGITNIAEVALANELGFRVIITDHHLPGPVLPVAEAIVNPHQHGCFFPFKELAGVGVAFFLAIGLRKEFAARGVWSSGNLPNLKKYLELVAIGTIADMVQLRGVNRILVKGGLEVINNNPSIGLKALIGEIGHKESKVTAETISYYLAPRINAAGRIGSAEEALRLLLADSDESAKSSAGLLGQANQKRKELTEELANRARYQANKQLLEGSSVIVVSGDGWHLGVVGLLASKMAQEYSRVAVVISIDDEGVARGSIRSFDNIDIHKCLTECEDILEKFGGHPQAAGLTIKAENIAEFHARFADSVGKFGNSTDSEKRLDIDLIINPNEVISKNILKHLHLFEPYGNGNPEPIFCSQASGLKLMKVQRVGVGSMRCKFSVQDGEINGIGFGMGEWVSIVENNPVNIAYKFCRKYFSGKPRWEIQIEDINKVI